MIHQCYEEYLPWVWMLAGMKIRTYVETGTYQGQSIAVARRYLPPEVKIATIDIAPAARETTVDGVWYLAGSSRDPAIARMIQDEFGEIDAVFIDGDHSYHGIKSDFDLWAPIAKRIVGMHDIACCPDVTRLFSELVAAGDRLALMASCTWQSMRLHIGYWLKDIPSDLPQESSDGRPQFTMIEDAVRAKVLL